MKSFLFMFVACTAVFAFAQAEPGGGSAGFPEGEISFANDVLQDADCEYFDDGGTDDLVTKFLNEKHYVLGAQWRKDKDGSLSLRIIAQGTGVVGALPGHSGYGAARSLAFAKAELDAKYNLCSFLETEIARTVEDTLTQPRNEDEEAERKRRNEYLKALAEGDSLMSKTIRLIHAKLNAALREEGIDVAGEQVKAQAELDEIAEKAKKIINSASFKQSINQATKRMIAGVQVVKTFESQPSDKNGVITVLVAWSPLLMKTAECMVSSEIPTVLRNRGKPVSEVLPKTPRELLSSFGVRQMIDENGQFVLLSFGQMSPRSMSRMSLQAAKEQAAMVANEQLRAFAGEAFEGLGELQRAETITELAGNPIPDYKDESSYSRYRKSASAKMKISGISDAMPIRGVKFPNSDQVVYVAVRKWSPQSASIAKQIGEQMNRSAEAGAMGQRSTAPSVQTGGYGNAPTSTPRRRNGYINSSPAADDDAF